MCYYVVYCLICLVIPTHQTAVTIVFDEDIRDCENGMPMPSVDISKAQIIPQEDGSIVINGSATMLKDYGKPTAWNFYTTRLERGQWVTGIASRQIVDICSMLQTKSEIWYVFTSKLNKKNCPYQNGHTEHMDMVNIGNPAVVFELPTDYMGEWRMYHEITTTRKGFPVRECFMSPAQILEV